MPPLNGPQMETLRGRLDERLRQLRGEIAQGLHQTSAPDDPGRPDEAVADLETGIALAEVERDAAELNAVLEALSRVEQGSYGLCLDCDAPIAFQRLLAQPQAPRCIRCETERDRVRARPSPPAL
jgi:DnaK suppressor protein